MINLLDAKIELLDAHKDHCDFMNCLISSRLGLSLSSECVTREWKGELRNKSANFIELKDFLTHEKRFEHIIASAPLELLEIEIEFKSLVNSLYSSYSSSAYEDYFNKDIDHSSYGDIDVFFKNVKLIFDYEEFKNLKPKEEYSSYKLAENLNIRACTYCNRVYSTTKSTRKKDKLMIPQLDHWFPRSKFPLFGVSFYNLIPSCPTCNGTIKSSNVLDLNKYCHPYINEPIKDSITFKYFFKNSLNEYHIFLTKNHDDSGKLLATANKMRIPEMYEAHQPELRDLISIKEKNTTVYLKKLSALFPNTQFTEEDVYRIAFGTEKLEKNFHLRPMSKFKYDILNGLDSTA